LLIRETYMESNKGIEPIGKEGRNLSGMDFFLLWSGAAVSLAEIWAGGLLVPLEFLTGFLAILIGHVIGNTPLAFGGMIGSRTGIPTMVAVRPSFGVRGSYFATVLNLVQLVGWTGIMLWIGGQAAQAVWPFPSVGFRGWVIICGFARTIWAILGHRYWKWLQRVAVTALIALCCVMSWVVLHKYGLSTLLAIPPKQGVLSASVCRAKKVRRGVFSGKAPGFLTDAMPIRMIGARDSGFRIQDGSVSRDAEVVV